MKRTGILTLAIILIFSMTACGRKNDDTRNTTAPATTNAIIPNMDPDIDKNIPDPDVNGNSTNDPTGTDGNNTSPTENNGGNANGNGNSNNSNSGMNGAH